MSDKPVSANIDVRLSVQFHRAPDVHTLLFMTSVRERKKLITEALRMYIEQTGHPAGERSAQLKAVETWLDGAGASTSMRASASRQSETMPSFALQGSASDHASSHPQTLSPSLVNISQVSTHDSAVDAVAALPEAPAQNLETSISRGNGAVQLPDSGTSSGALNRWLNDD